MHRWVPRPVDVAAAGVLTAAAQAEVWTGLVAGAPRPALAAAYAVGTTAAAWHRIAPVGTLATTLTALAVVPGVLGVDPNAGLSWFVAALAVIVSAGYHARRPLVALAVALGLLGATIVLERGLAVADVAYAWLLAGGGWLAGRVIADRTLRAELSEQRAALAEQQAKWRAAAAVADERLRIARELHDVVAHSLSVMTLHVGGVRRLLRSDQVAERAALEVVERTGRESLAEMHRMLGVLRGPGQGEPVPAPAAGLSRVDELLDAARAAGLHATLTVTGDVRPLPAGVEVAAYRIVQEAVTNVLRHSAASGVSCEVGYGPAAVELAVVDDGVGGSVPPGPGGHGHVGMRERVALYGGTVHVGPRQGGGYAVRAVLPLPGPAGVAEEPP